MRQTLVGLHYNSTGDNLTKLINVRSDLCSLAELNLNILLK